MKPYLLLASAIMNTLLVAYISITPIWSYNQAEVSALFPTAITPASYTFSIWSIIYLSWFALWIYAIWKKNNISQKNIILLIIAQFLSTLWLIPSQSLYIVTSFWVMLVLLVTLIYVLYNEKKNTFFKQVSALFFWWILIASIANFHQTLIALGLYLFPTLFTIFSIIIWTLVNLYIYYRYDSFIPAAVWIWAFIGIIIGQDNLFTMGTAWLWIISLSIYIWISEYKNESK